MREASFPQPHSEFLAPFQCALPAGFNNNDCFLVDGGWAKRVGFIYLEGKIWGIICVCERANTGGTQERRYKKTTIREIRFIKTTIYPYSTTLFNLTDNDNVILHFRCIKTAPTCLRPRLGSRRTNVHPRRSSLNHVTRLLFTFQHTDIKRSHGRASQSSQINNYELTECHSTVGGRTHRTRSCVQKQLDGAQRN